MTTREKPWPILDEEGHIKTGVRLGRPSGNRYRLLKNPTAATICSVSDRRATDCNVQWPISDIVRRYAQRLLLPIDAQDYCRTAIMAGDPDLRCHRRLSTADQPVKAFRLAGLHIREADIPPGCSANLTCHAENVMFTLCGAGTRMPRSFPSVSEAWARRSPPRFRT